MGKNEDEDDVPISNEKKKYGGFKFTPMPKYYSASRTLRNQAEKQRRDKMNYHVSELAALVPFVTRAQKKVDKTSVLRLAASYLRMHQILRPYTKDQNSLPVALLNSTTSKSLLNSIGGFLLVVTNVGKVIYVSETIEDIFGYSQADILGQTLYSLIHRDDAKLVELKLNSYIEDQETSSRCSFYCRLLEKSTSRNDPHRYEIIHVVGQLKPLPGMNCKGKPSLRRKSTTKSTWSVDSSEEEEEEEEGEENCQVNANRTGTHMLIAFVQIVKDKLITELTWVESLRDEYITRHRMDGNISYVDHRISFITGLMPDEVRGKSAFGYMHKDDILWSIIAHKQMMNNSQGQGIVTYRLLCKDGTYVGLHSRGYLEINKETGKVDSFICINTEIRIKDVYAEIKEQRRALLPIIRQAPEELMDSFARELPPDLAALVSQLINRQSLERMLNSIDDMDDLNTTQPPIPAEIVDDDTKLHSPCSTAPSVSKVLKKTPASRKVKPQKRLKALRSVEKPAKIISENSSSSSSCEVNAISPKSFEEHWICPTNNVHRDLQAESDQLTDFQNDQCYNTKVLDQNEFDAICDSSSERNQILEPNYYLENYTIPDINYGEPSNPPLVDSSMYFDVSESIECYNFKEQPLSKSGFSSNPFSADPHRTILPETTTNHSISNTPILSRGYSCSVPNDVVNNISSFTPIVNSSPYVHCSTQSMIKEANG